MKELVYRRGVTAATLGGYKSERNMIEQAVVLVGGLGTRLKDLTSDTPKPMLRVGDRPFLFWLVEEFRRQGVRRFLLLAGFQAGKIAHAFDGVSGVTVLPEPEPMGTGGALRLAAERLEDRFFFANGDSFFDIDLSDLARSSARYDAMLALREVEDVSRYGTVQLEGDRIAMFVGRAATSGPGLINGGVAVLTPGAVTGRPLKPFSIEADVFPELAREGRLGGKPYGGSFIDIGVPEDFVQAQILIPDLLAGR